MKQILKAAEAAGFFTLVDYGISIDDVNEEFALSKAYLSYPMRSWPEYLTASRPATKGYTGQVR
jgi:isopenicillin N synthase-like dioxygenase